MDPTALAVLLRDSGPWGLLALSLIALGWAVRGWMKCYEAQVALTERMAVGMEKSSQTIAAVSAALESRTGHFERLGDKIDELKRAVEFGDRAKHDEIQRTLDEIRRERRS